MRARPGPGLAVIRPVVGAPAAALVAGAVVSAALGTTGVVTPAPAMAPLVAAPVVRPLEVRLHVVAARASTLIACWVIGAMLEMRLDIVCPTFVPCGVIGPVLSLGRARRAERHDADGGQSGELLRTGLHEFLLRVG